MCGIAGILAQEPTDLLARGILLMTDAMRLRGPDGAGSWVSNDKRLALGHRRLAILDLSDNGQQPMLSASGRYRIVFNGEIYNHLSIRAKLRHKNLFRGTSDTESLLAAIEEWGLEATLQEMAGMFAFVLWDQDKNDICLVRDRLGIKPLYYTIQEGKLAFASDLSALISLQTLGFNYTINEAAFEDLLRYSFVAGEKSILNEVFKVGAGSLLRVDSKGKIDQKKYWLPHLKSNVPQEVLSFSKAKAAFEDLFMKTSTEHLLSDVPVGIFLSGGVDSAFLTTMLQKNISTNLMTFSIGFREGNHDEAPAARALAQFLGTDHHELYVENKDVLRMIEIIPEAFSEPFCDISQIPTLLVSEFASQHVKVALAGDGGDELFYGYLRYQKLLKAYRLRCYFPNFFNGVATSKSVTAWAGRFLERYPEELTRGLKAKSIYDFHRISLDQSRFLDRFKQHASGVDLISVLDEEILNAPRDQLLDEERILLFDQASYLIDDILVKTDRAGMAFSVEGRVPFLDHRVVELVQSLPFSFRFQKSCSKFLLKRILEKYIPENFFNQPKRGFGAPTALWLRGVLREFAEDQLAEFARDGELGEILNQSEIMKVWGVFCGSSPEAKKLDRFGTFFWNLILFMQWKRRWKLSFSCQTKTPEILKSESNKTKKLLRV